ncbi:MAG: hypothetical protein JO099_10460, partial [Acidobacteriia bacterium]|nr:hypothetical protein [Terriglobia bacterium]
IGLPTLAVMVGILVNGLLVQQLGARISSLENSVNSRFSSVETRLDILTGKVMEIDTRLTRLEERIEHLR